MTPETKTPTRAEALAALESLADRFEFEGERQAGLNYRTAHSFLSATDAPIVEGQEFKIVAFEGEIGAKTNRMTLEVPAGYPIRLGDTVTLYAQGRTQSAVPDDAFRRVLNQLRADIENPTMRKIYKDGWINHHFNCLEAMLSAAPPVTGGAWLPIETAPKDGTEIETDQGFVFWSERPVCMLGDRCGGFTAGWATGKSSGTDYNLPVDPPTKWKPAPPCSAEKEGV